MLKRQLSTEHPFLTSSHVFLPINNKPPWTSLFQAGYEFLPTIRIENSHRPTVQYLITRHREQDKLSTAYRQHGYSSTNKKLPPPLVEENGGIQTVAACFHSTEKSDKSSSTGLHRTPAATRKTNPNTIATSAKAGTQGNKHTGWDNFSRKLSGAQYKHHPGFAFAFRRQHISTQPVTPTHNIKPFTHPPLAGHSRLSM